MLFDRGQMVMVQLKAGKSSVEAEVMVDTGGSTVVVDTDGEPSKLRRLPRRAILGDAPKKTTVTVEAEPQARASQVTRSPSALFCVETDHGLCASQIQTRKLTKAEMVQGIWTMCDTWAQSKSAPLIQEPTCPRCRSRVGLSNKAA